MRAPSKGSLGLGLIVLAALGSTASARPAKPTVAILGLEVLGSVGPDQAKLARQLTVGLRVRASLGSGPFELAPNSERELVDEKLMNNCRSEALTCMASIGIALRADYLMWGNIEKVDKGYHVTLKTIRVPSKRPLPTFSSIVSVAEIRNDPEGLAKRAYAIMTAADEGDRRNPPGELVPSGEGTGAARPTEPGPGAGGGGASAKHAHEVMGVKSGGGGDGSGAGRRWTRVAIGTSILAGVAVGGFAASWGMLSTLEEGDGGSFSYQCFATDDAWACRHGRLLRGATLVTAIGAGVLAGFSAFAFYKGASAKERTIASGRSTRSRRQLTVTPVMSTSGGGAALRFDW